MESTFREKIADVISKLEGKKNEKLKMFIGIDGFVDEILHVVDKRHDFKNFDRIETIAEFGERITRAAGYSANFEFVPNQVKLGGNGPIFANALIEYGVGITYVGAVGRPHIHTVFQPMAEKSTVYSLCDPGHTDALEFNDGKLMLGKIEILNDIRWDRFKEVIGGVEKIAEITNQCELFGMENWTMVPYMNEIWEGYIEEIFPLIEDKEVKKLAFFDLADPEKRSAKDILYALDLIKKFNTKFRAVLGLNEKEVYEIAEVYGIEIDKNLGEKEKLQAVVTSVYDKLDIYCLVVHPTKCAAACTKEGYFYVEGPYCKKPILTTGAGDNFNAGFCLGQALGLSPEESLLTGVSTSGFYVRNAKSPEYEDLINFFKDWTNEKLV